MLRSHTLFLLPALMLSYAVLSPRLARAENPLERLHKKVFGDDHRKKDDDKKKKDKDKDKDHDHDHRHDYRYEDRRYDDRRYDDRGSYYQRQAPVVIQPRVYVEPSRPYYDNRYEPAPRSYSYNSRSLEADVQLALRRAGYYRGSIDGDIGPGTRSAIRDYQYDRRLPVTGRIDTSLLHSLGL